MENKSMSFQMPVFLYKEFVKYCKENGLNKSAVLRGSVYLYLKERITDKNNPIYQIIEIDPSKNS